MDCRFADLPAGGPDGVALLARGELEDDVPEVEEGMTSVEELIERIRIIHEMNEKNDLVKEQEKVFTEAADELYRIPAISRNMRRRNR